VDFKRRIIMRNITGRGRRQRRGGEKELKKKSLDEAARTKTELPKESGVSKARRKSS